MTETFHRRGHHVQSAHGRRHSLAADNDHTSGGMIALMPTAEDAKRLALPGGEAAAELHCTLLFLTDDGSQWTPEQRDTLEQQVARAVSALGPVQANVFGVAHWNGAGDKPSWVWNVGDDPSTEGPLLSEVRTLALVPIAVPSAELPEIPRQHSPWVAHICAAYTSDLTLTRALEKRLGPVTFDRVRLSFGDDDRDIPLTGGEALTAAALRRDPLPHEEACDFAEHNRQWEGAVASASSRLMREMADWRAQIREQITAGADTPEELASLTVETSDAEAVLTEAMLSLAERAGQSLVREAAKQGVVIDDWSLPEDTVTAAVGGRRLLGSVARMTADLMATSVVQSAKRVVTGLFTRDATPEAVAAEVDRALQEGQDSLIRSQVGTAMSTAQTAGRQAVLEAAPPGEYYASEMLDRNTCGPCKAVDGEQFGSLEIAIKAYPVMGYKDCVGPRYGNSCRGMIVARWTPEADEETEPVTAAGDVQPFHGSPGDPGYDMLHPGRGGKGTLIKSPKRSDEGDPLAYYRDDDADEDQVEADEELFSGYSSDAWSDPVSHYLRTGESDEDELYTDEEMDEMVAAMDRIADRHVLAEPVSLYRVAPASVYDGEEGNKVVDPAFMSTTVFKAITDQYRTEDDDVLIRIDMPEGAHVIPHRHLNPYGSAKGEVIVPRGLPLERKRREDGVLVYEPVMTDNGADVVEDDDTSTLLDDEADGSTAATMQPSTEMIGEGTVPWHKVSNHSECGDGKVAVVKDSDGSVAGCHGSEAEADKQLAALYASEGDSTVTTHQHLTKGEPNPGTDKDKRLKENKDDDCPPGMAKNDAGKCVKIEQLSAQMEVQGPAPEEIKGDETAPWRGPITVEGLETGDGRQFDSGALTWADLPLPLRWNKEDSHGGEPHTVAVNVGRIDKIWREESGLIMGEGVLDLSTDDGRTVHGKIKGQFLRGISVDVDGIKDADMELVWPDTDPDGEDEPDPFAQLFAAPEKVVFHKGRIRAATLVDIPAFAEAYVALLGEDGAVVAGGQPVGALRASASVRERSFAVQAPSQPPVDWFTNPDLSVPTGITVTPEGRVYGHAALWGTCHIGQAGLCVTPPREDDHPYFMTGQVWVTGNGGEVGSHSVGQITVGTGHAPLSLGHRAAADHYDNTGSAVADVAVGNDAHGIWVAGSVRYGTSQERIHELRAAGQVSGDWRRIGGQLRLVGLLAVNVPGFPVPKLRTKYVSGQQLALVAAGQPNLTEQLTEEELDQMAYARIMAKLSARVHGGE